MKDTTNQDHGQPRRYLQWRLYPMMAERGIRRVIDLHRRLVEVGVEISSTQLSRMISQRPKRITTEILDGLVTVLECDVSDLLRLEEAPAEEKGTKNAESRQEIKERPDPRIVGPGFGSPDKTKEGQ